MMTFVLKPKHVALQLYDNIRQHLVVTDDLELFIQQLVALQNYKQDKVKVQVKFTLEQATKARRGSRDIDILFLQSRR